MKGPGPCSPLVFAMVKTAATVHSPFLSGGVPTYSYTYASTLSLKLQGGKNTGGGGGGGTGPGPRGGRFFCLLSIDTIL